MCALWNDFELKRPPQITVPIRIENAPSVKRIHAALTQYFQRQRHNEAEFGQAAALLGRLMARRKNSFRGMKGFRAIVKCNAATCRLLRIDLTRDLEYLREVLPDFIPNNKTATTIEFPTRNSLDYVLVRLLLAQQVYERIRSCCQQATEYFAQMMSNNFFMDIIALLLAVLAKLYNYSALLGNKCVEVYNKLRPRRLHFPLLENCADINKDLPLQLTLFPIESTSADAEVQKTICSTPQASTTKLLTSTRATIVQPKKFKQDIGSEVSREIVKQPKQPAFDIDAKLTTITDVKNFITTENLARRNSLQGCITSKILSHEWLGATRLFERRILANDHKKALSIFCKFIKNKVH